MTILTQSDLRVHPSLRMHDHPDGGGAMASQPLTGEAGEIFPPVSDVDRTIGDFSARHIYFAVSKKGSVSLYGAHAILSKPPNAENVSFLLFPATKYAEERREIMQRIEAYSVADVESRMTLFSTQTKNSRIVQSYQRPEEPLPQVGSVYCLRQDKQGYEKAEQYIQIIRVKSENRTFINPAGKEFVRAVITMEISTPLIHDFIGIDYPVEDYADNPCKIRDTHVADGANYYGVKPLAAAIQAQSQKIQVPSIFEKIVPTSQVETPLIDLIASGQKNPIFQSGNPINQSQYIAINANTILHLGNAITPNSLSIKGDSYNIKDEGGTLKNDGLAVGTVDYYRGEVRFNKDLGGNYWVIDFTPAATIPRIADTAAISVGIGNRGYNYLMTITPPPAPNTMTVSYRAQGKWYDLRDDGSGALIGGSAAHGSGNINFISGTCAITCGAMPDVGSEILFSWGSKVGLENRSDSQPVAKMIFQLSQTAIAPNTVVMKWNDGSDRTAQDNGQGKITGDWIGEIDYRTGKITIDTSQNFHHPRTMDVRIEYSSGEAQQKEFKAPLRNRDGTVTLDLEQTQIKPHSFVMTWNLLIEDFDTSIKEDQEKAYWEFRPSTNRVDPYKTVRDNGSGRLVDPLGKDYGEINYSSGLITFNPDAIVSIPKTKYKTVPMGEKREVSSVSWGGTTFKVTPLYRFALDKIEYFEAAATMPIDESAFIQTRFRGNQDENSQNEILPSGKIEIDLLPSIAEKIVPNSLRIKIGENTYFDRRGAVYYQQDIKTGSATQVGKINYETGIISINQWQGANIKLKSLATLLTGNPVDEVTFRTPSAPLRPKSLTITATPLTGGQLQATADGDSKILTDGIEGYVDVETGVVRVRFGKKVKAEGHENAIWYHPDAIDEEGNIWQPILVHAETITFSAVSYSYLPLDTSQIGIDAVRLPSDGLVPWIRRGDMVIIANHQSDNLGSVHTARQTHNLSRQNVDKICVRDADDKPINANLYTVDLTAGTITWADPLDLSGYKMPITAHHSIERENRVIDVDITGELTLQFPIDIELPKENTYVSSALLGGDLEPRGSAPFSQMTWNKSWLDTPDADPILAKLNVKDAPIELSSDGAINQRWAIRFQTDTQFQLIGETLGLIAEGNILNDLAPINPSTGNPYFTIPRAAFGSGWSTGNVVRFNTYGTQIGAWLIRAVQPSPKRQQNVDGVTFCLRGNTE